jgi:hypothetical protein
MGENNVTEYNCSALIQKLNAVVATSDDDRANSELLLNPPNICTKIEDVNSEKHRNILNEEVGRMPNMKLSDRVQAHIVHPSCTE